MRILIAYDGSGYSRIALCDLQYAGLPDTVDVAMISVSEMWLPPEKVVNVHHPAFDNDTFEYFHQHSEQMHRNLAETKAILVEAKEKLQSHFPKWNIETESIQGSPAKAILKKVVAFLPNLIVAGTRGLSFDSRSGLGTVSQNILSYSKVSTRIVRGKADIDRDRLKIVICLDNSPCSLEAVRTVALRKWPGKPEVRLFIVTDPLIALVPGRVFQIIAGIPEGRMRGEEMWAESLASEALGTLQTAGLTASAHILSGNPRVMLVNEAKEWKADTIFIGSHSGQSHCLGGIALGVSARASCSVEVITKTLNNKS